MQESHLISMSLGAVIALSLTAGVGAAAGLLGLVVAAWQANVAERAAAPRLDYEVVTVPAGLAAEYQKLHPLLYPMAVFVEAVLGDSACGPWHESLRAEAHRRADQNPGKALFVKVNRMP
jgi:hypothetical protein